MCSTTTTASGPARRQAHRRRLTASPAPAADGATCHDTGAGGATRLGDVVLLAGGQGVQLRPYTTRLPKQLVPLGDDHSVLEVALRQLAAQGFRRAVLSVGTFSTIVQAYVGDGSQWGIGVDYVREDSSLGPLGLITALLDRLPEHFVVVNGEILTDLDYGDLLARHVMAGSGLTVATARREDRVDFGVLEIDGQRVRGFAEKPRLHFPVSMGVYALSARCSPPARTRRCPSSTTWSSI